MPETVRPTDTEDRWVADMIYGGDPSPAPTTHALGVGADRVDVDDLPTEDAHAADLGATSEDPAPTTDPRLHPVIADDDPTVDVDNEPEYDLLDDGADQEATAARDAGAKRTAVALGAGLVVTLAVIVTALMTFGDGSAPAGDEPDRAPVAAPVAETPVPTSAAPTVPQDQSIPYTASAPCAAGSTSAQSLTDTASDSAWVCARGSRDEALEGKVLTVDFRKTYMLSGVEVTPGWVAKTPGGQDQWLQHRVVTRLQYIFLNGNVVSDVFTQDTGNVHGPVTAALPRRVLASRVNVIVLQTSRPPGSPLPSAAPDGLPEAQPGLVESLLGEGGAPLSPDISQGPEPYPDLTAPDSGSDPVDNTFAMSALKFLGYQP
jgi:hypothetical protein